MPNQGATVHTKDGDRGESHLGLQAGGVTIMLNYKVFLRQGFSVALAVLAALELTL